VLPLEDGWTGSIPHSVPRGEDSPLPELKILEEEDDLMNIQQMVTFQQMCILLKLLHSLKNVVLLLLFVMSGTKITICHTIVVILIIPTV
jgi:hypothetical protein